MKKPKKYTTEYYDYSEVEAYVSHKLGYETRDVAGKFSDNPAPEYAHLAEEDRPYLDFWHWLIDLKGDEIHRGCYIKLDAYDGERATEDWQQKILKEFMAVTGEAELWVDW